MTKVYGLSLPEPFEGAKTDDPLASVLSLCYTSTSVLAGQSILHCFGKTHHQMYWPSSMDFIYDIERASSAICNGTSPLTRWLEIPDGSAKSRVSDDFRSSERHIRARKQ